MIKVVNFIGERNFLRINSKNKNGQSLKWTIQQREIELYNKPVFSVSAEICGIKIIKNESD